MIVNAHGTILTALHVVDGAGSLRVAFVDGTRSTATVAGLIPTTTSPSSAGAGPEVIVPAVLGGGGQVGDEAYAVGHPLGYVASLSSGVISGLDRSAPGARTASGLRA